MRPVMLSADSIKWSSPQRRAPLGQLISITNFAGDKRDVAVSHRWQRHQGRISLLKRGHGLNRGRYKGQDGMKRWVGFGVIADNLINIGRALAPSADG
jgi:hypothetical protein